MWGCGLKFLGEAVPLIEQIVTPYVGVWIEIASTARAVITARSPPMWGCGLKYLKSRKLVERHGSPPMWGCGLKLLLSIGLLQLEDVTPYVGVWIEILKIYPKTLYFFRHPLCGGVD